MKKISLKTIIVVMSTIIVAYYFIKPDNWWKYLLYIILVFISLIVSHTIFFLKESRKKDSDPLGAKFMIREARKNLEEKQAKLDAEHNYKRKN